MKNKVEHFVEDNHTQWQIVFDCPYCGKVHHAIFAGDDCNKPMIVCCPNITDMPMIVEIKTRVRKTFDGSLVESEHP